MTEKAHTCPEIDVDLVREALGRLITRNETHPMRRASFRLGYARNMRDLGTHPDRHLAGAVDIISRHGPTYEAGLQLGACMVLCAFKGTKHHETFSRMLAEIKSQQDAEEQPKGKTDGTADPSPASGSSPSNGGGSGQSSP